MTHSVVVVGDRIVDWEERLWVVRVSPSLLPKLEWWSKTAADRQTLNWRCPKVASAERVLVGETRIYHHHVDEESVLVLAVSASDIDAHTNAAVGRWIVANTY
ncbi:hypothetical protein ABH922_005181 [Rhodococcus sp. 27YEA15]